MRKIIVALVLALFVVLGGACGDGRMSPQGGTLTGVSAGSGVTGGGTAGNVVVNVGAGSGITVTADNITIDPTYTQRRVTGTCGAGSAVGTVNVDGTVVCNSAGATDGDKGDLTISVGGTVYTLDAAVVTFAKMANIATGTFIGRVTALSGSPEALTGTQATTLLDVFTSGLKGLVPASGGGTVNYLRADGTFAAPPGSGIVTDGDKGDVVVTGTGTVWDVDTGVVGITELTDNLDLSANGATTLGDTRGKVQAITNGTGTVAGSQAINADTTIYRATAGSPTQLNGITASGRADGSMLCVYINTGVLQFNHENAGAAAAADRFNLPNSVAWTFSNGGGCFSYDGTTSRWKLYSVASATLPSLTTTAAASIGTSLVVGTTLNALLGLSGSNTSSIRFVATAQTASLSALDLQNTGTFNTTAGALNSHAVRAVNTATRSAGANNLTNYGVYAEASGAQVNYAGWFQGNVNVAGTSNMSAPNDTLTVARNGTAITSQGTAVAITSTGTIDTTAAPITSYGMVISSTATRSAGANDAGNVGILASASGGQTNFALVTSQGDVSFNNSSGNTTINGNAIFGNASTDTVTITGRTTNTYTGAAETGSRTGINATMNGTHNTTAGGLSSYAIIADNTSTRSAGANNLTNYGIYATASGAQVNYAGWFEGAVTVTGDVTLGVAVTNLVTVVGDLTVADTVNLNGNTTIGNATTDTLTLTSKINSNVQSTGAPSASSCGTSPAVVGGRLGFRVTVGSGTVPACTLTFASAFDNAPTCVTSIGNAGANVDLYIGARSTSAITIENFSAANMAGTTLDVICVGH